MIRMTSWGLTVAGAVLTAVSASAAPPAVPATPARVDDLVYAAPFTLREGYAHDWRAERPLVTRGYLVVLRVQPALVYPRQVAEPVLYVGNQTAERLNVGYRSGHVVAIVPGDVDLKTAPLWFGTPALPEQVNASAIDVERLRAARAGIRAVPTRLVARAVRVPLALGSKADLLREAGALVDLYASDEEDLARALKGEDN